MPGENAPEHRHTQHAFRFVLEGEGVWTVVGGDPVAMRRGDFLPQAGWNWHAHHNATAEPMAWIDGLDIPLQYITEAQFFEFGRDEISDAGADHARALARRAPLGPPGPGPGREGRAGRATPGSPLLAYRWEHTDRALADQLAMEREGYPGTVEPGHAAVRYTDPATGGDVLPTIRVEMHRIARNAETSAGPGDRVVGLHRLRRLRHRHRRRQDLVGRAAATCSWCPSWQPFSARSEAGATDSDSGALDLFRFSDSPVFEALKLNRASTERARGEPGSPTSSSSAAASAASPPRSR